jgi:hypothetical protein
MVVGDRLQGRGRDDAAQAARHLLPDPDGAQRRRVAGVVRGQMAADPTGGRAVEVGETALHQLHGLEVTARLVGGAAGMHDRPVTRLPRRQKRRQRRVDSKETIQIQSARRRSDLAIVRARDRQRRTEAVVCLFAVRDDHVQAVGGPA